MICWLNYSPETCRTQISHKILAHGPACRTGIASGPSNALPMTKEKPRMKIMRRLYKSSNKRRLPLKRSARSPNRSVEGKEAKTRRFVFCAWKALNPRLLAEFFRNFAKKFRSYVLLFNFRPNRRMLSPLRPSRPRSAAL